MKIICDKKEFAEFIRSCDSARMESDCKGCVFMSVCDGAEPEDVLTFEIVGDANGRS